MNSPVHEKQPPPSWDVRAANLLNAGVVMTVGGAVVLLGVYGLKRGAAALLQAGWTEAWRDVWRDLVWSLLCIVSGVRVCRFGLRIWRGNGTAEIR